MNKQKRMDQINQRKVIAMEKMKLETGSMTEKNIDKIASLFPNCITETLDEEKSTSDKKFTGKRFTLRCPSDAVGCCCRR